jgi:DNA-binding transcriptional LysR family regulator
MFDVTSSDFDRANELVVQQLRSFCLVFEHQSYSAAAREIGRSVPTLWEQVQAVEKRYGVLFFYRDGRRIVPTQAAEMLYNSLAPLLAGLDSTFEQVRELQKNGSSTVTLIGGVRMLCEELVEPLRRFHEQFPRIVLRLLHGDDNTAVKMVADGSADLALTLERGPEPVDVPVTCERAYTIDYLAIFLSEHPLKKSRNLQLRQLRKRGRQATKAVRALMDFIKEDLA